MPLAPNRLKTLLAATGILALTVAPQLLIAQSQTWEKLIIPGLTYRMEVDLGLPRVIHAFRYTPGSGNVFSRPELAGSQVFMPDNATKGREALTTTIQTNGALAGINADFFPWSGDPIGMMVRQGELLSLPFPDRSVFAWGANYFASSPVKTTLTVRIGTLQKTVDGLNEEAKDNALTLFTPASGIVRSATPGTYAILKTQAKLPVSGELTGVVTLVTPDLKTSPIKEDEVILVATGNQASVLSALSKDQSVTFSVATSGINPEKTIHAVAGGPRLITAGKIALNSAAEKFPDSFSTTMHPRTAVGSTASGDIWLVTIDGRQAMSRGSSLEELARVMQRLGCTEAINLDGGGSTTLALGALVLNRPSDNGLERAICNSILLFGQLPEPVNDLTYVIKGVPNLEEGGTATYTVIDSRGQKVPANSVIWAAQGAAWIDQSGVLRTLSAGKAKVSAWIQGKIATVEIEVVTPLLPGTPNPKF